MVDKYFLQLEQNKNVNNRIYKVWENDKLISETTKLDDINGLILPKNQRIKIVIEPEVVGVKLLLILFLQFFSGSIDRYFFTSFFYDIIEFDNYTYEKLKLTYSYSFDDSFILDKNISYNQRKIISVKNFYTLLGMFFVPIFIIIFYCIVILLLAEGYAMMRILLIFLLCLFLCYLYFQFKKLSKFIEINE